MSLLNPALMPSRAVPGGAIDASGAVTEVDVHADAGAILPFWAELEALAPASVYQTRAWLLPWIDTIGAARGITPMLVTGRDAAGRPALFLPLGVMWRGPFRLAEFLGHKDANFALGLLRPGLTLDRLALTTVLREAARKTPGGVDLFALVNQPERWGGHDNPLMALDRQTSPVSGHSTALGGDGDAFLKRLLSADTRKKLRAKGKKLAAQGPVAHVVAGDAAEARDILDAFTRFKAARMAIKGVENAFAGPGASAFLERACVASRCVELNALTVGGRIVATFGGASHQGRFCGMFNAFDPDPGIARSSPGDLLLTKMLAAKCGHGTEIFDLGAGEARYKSMFCDTVEPLFDAYVAVTPAGKVLEAFKRAKRMAKRRIKQSPGLWAAVERLRAMRRDRARR